MAETASAPARGEALLVMDVQNGIVARLGARAQTILPPLQTAVAGARAAGVPVIFVRVAFRRGMPEVSPRNRSFSALGRVGGMEEDGPGTQIAAAVAPAPGEVIVTKRRVSAFSGSDLDVVLRARGSHALVLAGISTSGVVLSTLRQAADLDYGLTVLKDGCADADEEIHRVLLEKIFPRQAAVLTAEEWVRGLAAPVPPL
jgi:nicotinamidase-related amidase